MTFIESKAQIEHMKEYENLFKDVHLVERKPTPVENMMKSELPESYSHYICHNMRSGIEDILSKNGIDIVQVELSGEFY